MLTERLIQIGELLEQLRPQVRPEGDAAYGAIRTALDQAKADAADIGAPVPLTPIDVQLAELATGAANDRAMLSSINTGVQSLIDAAGV